MKNKKTISILTLIFLSAVLVFALASCGNKHTVKFDLNGSNETIPSQKVNDGEKIIMPSNPTREGYIFIGWYLGDDLWSFTDNGVTENMTLVAKWDINDNGVEYTLSRDRSYYSVSGYKGSGGTVGIRSTLDGIPVTEISPYSFNECDNLVVIIPDSITRIFTSAFISPSSIIVDENNENYKSVDGNLYSKDGKTLLQYAQGKSDTEFTIPEGVEKIAQRAFYQCTNLKSVTFSDSVTHICSYAFSGCNNITTVTITDGITRIDEGAFSECAELTTVIIPKSVTEMGTAVFISSPKITEITVDDDNTAYKSVDGNLYSKDGKVLIQYAVGKTITEFIIPDGVESIELGALVGCNNLQSVTIPASVTSLGSAPTESLNSTAFQKCESITNITVSENNTVYSSKDGNVYSNDGKQLIQYAIGKKDKSFEIPDGVTVIGKSAFYHCTALTSITIPDSVITIREYAFSGCTGLTNIIIPINVEYVGNNAFYINSDVTIYCEAEARPPRWHHTWNPNEITNVVWGYSE